MSSIAIRTASPDEIDEVIAIDEDACELFRTVGLYVEMGPDHPFTRAEHARWLAAAGEGRAFLAGANGSVGLLVVGFVDGLPFVEQLSVRTGAMRRGIGRALLRHAIEWARREPLWLTTYWHVPWNRPFYERAGFTVMPAESCPSGVIARLEEERRWLPHPAQRIAMRYL